MKQDPSRQPRASNVERRPSDRIPLLIIVGLPIGFSLWGLPYYLLTTAGRVRSPLHHWLKPSGVIGQSAGLLALVLFVFMWLYPLRKKVRWLAFTGPIGEWLHVHTLAGIAIPLLAAIHAGWRFDGVIGLGYGAILLVSASGIIGRYLFVRIPRSQSGIELSLDEANAQRRALVQEIAATTGLMPEAVERLLEIRAGEAASGVGAIFARLLSDDWRRWKAERTLRQALRTAPAGARVLDRRAIGETMRLARREMSLSQQLRMLGATRRVFGYWHVAHRPVAITALLAVMIHVAVTIAVGATWLR